MAISSKQNGNTLKQNDPNDWFNGTSSSDRGGTQ
jgi:hypothetical protein